jgi:NADPH2:quinone reductase
MVQGLTAWHLLRTSTHLAKGESVVVHAAAGGVGTLAVQLAKAWGAGTVIGVASSPEKRQLAESLGADVTVDAGAPDLKAALERPTAAEGRRRPRDGGRADPRRLPGGAGAVRPPGDVRRGLAPADQGDRAGALMARSRGVIGFWLAHCFSRPEMLGPPMAELLSMVEAGTLTPIVGGTYPLSKAHEAHEALLSRASQGKLVLDTRS